MSSTELAFRLLFAVTVAGALVAFGLVVRNYREEHTDPSLSPRGWNLLWERARWH